MISCKMCGHKAHYLVPHLQEAHGLLETEYSGEVVSPQLQSSFDRLRKPKPRRSPKLTGLSVGFAGIEMPVNTDVPGDACATLPLGYRVPQHGNLADDIRRIAVRYAHGNSKPIWVWGPPGTGKDAVFQAISAVTRRPCAVFNIAPDVDIQAWLATRAFSPTGTFWEEGPLLRALRDGYVSPSSGRRVPYLIVLSDLDRASRSQMEPLRAILDSLGGRIQSPDGMHKVLPGTLVVATANTSGGGDHTGRYTSSVVDLSILDRFTFKVRVHNMDPRDEEILVREKYPVLVGRFPDLPGTLMRCVTAIRDAIDKEEILIDFGHRTVSNWVDAMVAEAMASPRTKDTTVIMKAGLQDILSGAPNEDTREAIKRLCDPHLKGGVAVEEE